MTIFLLTHFLITASWACSGTEIQHYKDRLSPDSGSAFSAGRRKRKLLQAQPLSQPLSGELRTDLGREKTNLCSKVRLTSRV
jgi:hypothetical protein